MISRRKVTARVCEVNQKTGQVTLIGNGFVNAKIGAGAVVYHEYLTGECLVGHLVVKAVGTGSASAIIADPLMLKQIRVGDRVVCQWSEAARIRTHTGHRDQA
jgi:hypothetical protein